MTEPLTLAAQVKAAPGQLSTQLDGEVVILNTASGSYFSLDSVGTDVWNHIQTPCQVARVHEQLLAKYEVEPARCERDLLELLVNLRAAGLLEVLSE